MGQLYRPSFYKSKKWLEEFDRIDSKFSISGGGDPMFNFDKHTDFWSLIEQKAISLGITYDIHTADPSVFNKYLPNLGKVVYHVTKEVKVPLHVDIPVRWVMVLDSNVTMDDIEEFEQRDGQITYREVFGEAGPSKEVTEFAKSVSERHFGGKYLVNGDYNRYLFPNGDLRERFQTNL
jgi:hypothetical protein